LYMPLYCLGWHYILRRAAVWWACGCLRLTDRRNPLGDGSGAYEAKGVGGVGTWSGAAVPLLNRGSGRILALWNVVDAYVWCGGGYSILLVPCHLRYANWYGDTRFPV